VAAIVAAFVWLGFSAIVVAVVAGWVK
jgi:hypothetical protein